MSEPLHKRQPPLIARLLLVISLLLALLPHLTRLPLWLAGGSLSVIVWRLLRDYREWPLPGMAIRLLLTLLGMGSVLLVFHTIIGREPGTALLSVMICLKLLELRTVRNAITVIFLGYFLVLADFLFDASIATGLYMFTVVLFLSATLIALNHPAATLARTPHYLKRASSLLIQAAPLMVLFFLLFPRINTPLWNIPDSQAQAKTGLSDEMHLGYITDLAESDELVFRAEFSSAIPSADKLYWRGPVLWNTDGRSWFKLSAQQLARISTRALRYETESEPVHYTVMLEPQKGSWLFALDLPAQLPEIEEGSRVLPDFQLVANRKLQNRVRYTMSSVTAYRTSRLESWEQEYALRLPEQANPRTRQLGQRWRTESKDDAGIVEHALGYFRSQPFFYTRHPPALGNEPVDEFLFSTRQGFCEHYASAFVTLMRAAGIPSRVVTGYQGGELNTVGNFLEVRQNHAHAWAEVWLNHQGWVRVDPTAVIPPERVLDHDDTLRFTSTAPTAPALLDSPLMSSGLLKLQQGWNAVNYTWNVWVIGFNSERQQALLKRWGLDKLEFTALLATIFILVGITFAIIATVVLYRRPGNEDPVLRFYRRFCRRLEKAGIECLPHEGPQQLRDRAVMALPAHADAIREIIALFVSLRYGRGDASQLITLRRLVSGFRP